MLELNTPKLAKAATQIDRRPEDCDCGEWNQGSSLSCWPCFREGYETPNPVAVEVEQ